ncbi:MAG TPA: TolC family protein [Sphingobacterium sp.]|nr:TolC family protein [Sphingobacterium sp.]
MRTVLIHPLILPSCMGCVFTVQAQSTLKQYIRQGLDNNLTVTQKKLSIQKAMNALEVARTMYLPNVSFDMTYSTATGGRSILLPVGDLLNPVYNTLNQLTQSQLFPQIENEKINFLPRNYYDARFRTLMPVINTDIKHNKAVSEQLVQLRETDLEIYKRELVKNIKQAYYHYLSTSDAVKIYQNTLQLAHEGKRVHEKLLEAGSGLHAYVVRADAEIAQVEAQLSEAEQQKLNAQYYFNMLLNRAAHDPIDMLENPLAQLTADKLSTSVDGREELGALNQQIAIQETLVKINKQVFLPKLNAFLDIGSQAENIRFNLESQYVMIGAQLSFPIFEGNRNRLKIKESQIAVAEVQNQLTQVRQQLELAVRIAQNEVKTTAKNYEAAKQQVEAAITYQRLIQRGFNEGVNTYIETVDARSQFTSARLAENLAAYKWLVAQAKLERETATYPLSN